jgi:hypothetical protein
MKDLITLGHELEGEEISQVDGLSHDWHNLKPADTVCLG